MGMIIGSNNSNKITIPLYNKDGSSAGTLSITKAKNNRNKKKKKLGYSFKKISSQIMQSKTASNAGQVARRARSNLVLLQMKKTSGEYDEQELKSAIAHAKEMVRIARKRRKHMEEEERAKKSGFYMEEDEPDVAEKENEEEEQRTKIDAEELEKLAEEMQELTEESMEDLNQMIEEMVASVREDVDPDDLERIKKEHRSEELRDIMMADLKYLKALFDRLAKEQREASSGVSGGSDSANSSGAPGGVTLELSGIEVPVETMEAPVSAEGAAVDVTV